jgi:hypothetical protein
MRFDAGTLYYAIQPAITMSANPTSVDYDHQTVTFTGTLTGTYPDGSTGPVAGQEIDITQVGSTVPLLTTTTGSDGAYQVSGPNEGGQYWAMVPSSDTIFPGNSDFTNISQTADPVILTATVSTTRAKYKQGVTITGTVTYLPAGGSVYQPLAGGLVQVYDAGSTPSYSSDSATTASDGTFSISHQMLYTTALTVGAGVYPAVDLGSYWFKPVTLNLPKIAVALPVHINSLTAKVDAFGKLTVHGCAYATWEGGTEHGGMPMSVEYSAHSTGPWTALGTVHSGNYACPNNNGYEFVGRFPVKLATAYYRVDWAGSAYYQPASTKADPHEDHRAEGVSDQRDSQHSPNGQRATLAGQWGLARLWWPPGPDHPAAQGQHQVVLDGQAIHQPVRALHRHLRRPGQRALVRGLRRRQDPLRHRLQAHLRVRQRRTARRPARSTRVRLAQPPGPRHQQRRNGKAAQNVTRNAQAPRTPARRLKGSLLVGDSM